jgi:hypothetical protein
MMINTFDRNDAPNGLLLSLKYLKGVHVHNETRVKTDGFDAVNFEDDPLLSNVVHWMNRATQHAVTFGAGVTTQELNDALELSGLFTIGAAHGGVSVAGGWVCKIFA